MKRYNTLITLAFVFLFALQINAVHAQITDSRPKGCQPLTDILSELNDEGEDIRQVALTEDGSYFVLWGRNGYRACGLPDDAADKLTEINDDAELIRYFAFDDNDNWMALWSESRYSGHVPTTLADYLRENELDGILSSVSFTPDGGWVITWGKNGWAAKDVPSGLVDALKDLNDRGETLRFTAFPDEYDAWLVVWGDNGVRWSDISEGLEEELRNINTEKYEVKSIAFTYDGWAVIWGRNGWTTNQID